MTKFTFIFRDDAGIGGRVADSNDNHGWLIRWKVQDKQAYIIWDDVNVYEVKNMSDEDYSAGNMGMLNIAVELCELGDVQGI